MFCAPAAGQLRAPGRSRPPVLNTAASLALPRQVQLAARRLARAAVHVQARRNPQLCCSSPQPPRTTHIVSGYAAGDALAGPGRRGGVRHAAERCCATQPPRLGWGAAEAGRSVCAAAAAASDGPRAATVQEREPEAVVCRAGDRPAANEGAQATWAIEYTGACVVPRRLRRPSSPAMKRAVPLAIRGPIPARQATRPLGTGHSRSLTFPESHGQPWRV